MRFSFVSPDESLNRNVEKAKEKYAHYEKMSPFDRVVESIGRITEVLGGKTPEVVLMNLSMFTEWFHWCKENDYDFTNVEGVEVVLDRDSPAKVSFIAEKNRAFLNKMKEK